MAASLATDGIPGFTADDIERAMVRILPDPDGTVVAVEDGARAGIELSVEAANERATALYRAHDLEPAIEWSHWVLALDR